jgi:hypothetical protein
MIKMIKGTYGRKVNGVVEAMTKHSGPFSLSATREAELVAAGVAVKVEEPAEANTYENMKMAELRKAAAALGVDVSTAKTKKEVIAMLEAAEAQEETPEPEADTGEDNPGEL